MKTLMLLLLISSPAWGQDIDKLLSQYEAECYADSTQEDVHDDGGTIIAGRMTMYGTATPCWIETDNSPVVHWDPPIVTCRRPDHWKKYWKHRGPTYQGFKEFVGITDSTYGTLNLYMIRGSTLFKGHTDSVYFGRMR